jgi:prepilin signal peptidase PulO-like enzyme (type II secretory pathway)
MIVVMFNHRSLPFYEIRGTFQNRTMILEMLKIFPWIFLTGSRRRNGSRINFIVVVLPPSTALIPLVSI